MNVVKWLLVTCALVITLLLLLRTGHAHTNMVDLCFRGPEPAVKVGEKASENGLLSELYDRNGDGQVDIEVMTPIRATVMGPDGKEVIHQHDKHPLFYAVDETKGMAKGEPTMLYIDKDGRGQCSSIVKYRDLTVPHMPDKDHREGSSNVGGI